MLLHVLETWSSLENALRIPCVSLAILTVSSFKYLCSVVNGGAHAPIEVSFMLWEARNVIVCKNKKLEL